MQRGPFFSLALSPERSFFSDLLCLSPFGGQFLVPFLRIFNSSPRCRPSFYPGQFLFFLSPSATVFNVVCLGGDPIFFFLRPYFAYYFQGCLPREFFEGPFPPLRSFFVFLGRSRPYPDFCPVENRCFLVLCFSWVAFRGTHPTDAKNHLSHTFFNFFFRREFCHFRLVWAVGVFLPARLPSHQNPPLKYFRPCG